MIAKFETSTQAYDAREEAQLKRAELFYRSALSCKKTEEIETKDKHSSLKKIYLKENAGIAFASTGISEVVLDTSVDEAASWEFMKDTRWNFALFKERQIVRQELIELNDHSTLILNTKDYEEVLGLWPRSFRTRAIWKRSESGERAIVSFEPTKELGESERRLERSDSTAFLYN